MNGNKDGCHSLWNRNCIAQNVYNKFYLVLEFLLFTPTHRGVKRKYTCHKAPPASIFSQSILADLYMTGYTK